MRILLELWLKVAMAVTMVLHRCSMWALSFRVPFAARAIWFVQQRLMEHDMRIADRIACRLECDHARIT